LTRTRDLVDLIDPATGDKIATLESPDLRNVASLGFSPDGSLLAVTYQTNSIRIWDLKDLCRHLADLDLDWDDLASEPAREEYVGASSPGVFEIELPPWFLAMREAEELAIKGRHSQAAKAYGIVIDAGAATPEIYHRQALLFLATGQTEDYHRTCRAMVERFGQDVPPGESKTMAWTMVLGSNPQRDLDTALRLARSAVAALPTDDNLNTLGGALFRAGRGREAIETLLRAIETQGQGGTPLDWVLMALALAHERRNDDARRWLDRVSAWEASGPSPMLGEVTRWEQKVELKVLRAEAESQLSARKP
jgi:hypothetical protein